MSFNPLKWFRNTTTGVFVEVFLDYGFGKIIKATSIADKGPFKHTLYIPDLSLEKAEKVLKGRKFDWGIIHSHWRHYLELEKRFYKASWEDVQKYLKEI